MSIEKINRNQITFILRQQRKIIQNDLNILSFVNNKEKFYCEVNNTKIGQLINLSNNYSIFSITTLRKTIEPYLFI